MRLADIWREKISCIIHTSTQEEANMLFKAINSYDHNGTTWASWWNVFKKKTCYRTNLGEVVAYGCLDNYIGDGEEVIEFSDLVATGGTLPTSEWSKLIFKNGSSIEVLPQKDDTVKGENHFCDGFRGGKIPTSGELIVSHTEMERAMDSLSAWATNVQLDKETVFNGLSQVLKRATEVYSSTKEEKNLKFTFYTEEGYRIDKSNNSKVETITTFVKINGFDNTYLGMATCDKVDFDEREGVLNAIANAVCGGNFDREYEKFLADKKHKYDESCKCKICGRNYYEDEKTGKRTPFTPEDARKHEEWHEQNKKIKREKYLIRKEAKRRLAEAEREGKIEQTMKELYKK